MVSTPSLPPPSNIEAEWAYLLDEAAIRDDGGANDIAHVPSRDTIHHLNLAYHPPSAAYEAALWESTRKGDSDVDSQPQPVAGAGWIVPNATDTAPVFVAHSMLAAVWLLRASLTCSDVLTDDMWARLTQAAGAGVTTNSANNASVDDGDEEPEPAPPASRTRRRAPPLPANGAAAPDAHASNARRSKRHASPSSSTVQGQAKRQSKPKKKSPPHVVVSRADELGLRELDANASDKERAVRQSVPPTDAPSVAWILEQPGGVADKDFLGAAGRPYSTAMTMLRHARAIGNDEAKGNAASFVRSWRRLGSPLRFDSGSSAMLQHTASTQSSSLDFEWDVITASEKVAAAVSIIYRWGMASLGRRYQRKIDELRAAASAASTDIAHARKANDQTWRTEAKNALFDSWVERKPSVTRESFSTKLKRASKWYDTAQALGWGLLVLIPASVISATWIEQTLRAPELDIWLNLIPRVNPAAVEASKRFDEWIGAQGHDNGPLAGAPTLSIEVEHALSVDAEPMSRITEVPDSDAEGSNGSNDGDDRAVGGEVVVHSTANSSLPAVPSSRSLDLRQLFQPIHVLEDSVT